MKPSISLIPLLLPLLAGLAACTPLPEPIPGNPGPGPDYPAGLVLEGHAEIGETPTFLTHAGDGSGRLFVTTRTGQIFVLQNGRVRPKPFLDLREVIDSASLEQGLLGLAFPPDYSESGQFYVNYTNLETDNDTIIARYRVSSDRNLADPDSGEVLLFIEQPANNHNGGHLAFGPDGYLYAGLGDGGQGNDPWGNGQNPHTLLGAILRLDISPDVGYSIPVDNPFANGEAGAPEIWAIGLRNPWRFSFDRETGKLFVADVGQNEWEEFTVVAGDQPGINYGWNLYEGDACFRSDAACEPEGLAMPAFTYGHGEDGCSITGGYVYRGREHPELSGTYFFGDFCSGKVWGAREQADGSWRIHELFDTDLSIVSFGENEDGEVFVLDREGAIYRITVRP